MYIYIYVCMLYLGFYVCPTVWDCKLPEGKDCLCMCVCVEVSLLFLATTQVTRYHRQHSDVNELMKERMNGIIYLI